MLGGLQYKSSYFFERKPVRALCNKTIVRPITPLNEASTTFSTAV